jgi:hypothetical protein
VTAALSVVPTLTPVEQAWLTGIAVGESCAAWLGTDMHAHALELVANAKACAPRATSAAGALKDCYSLNLAVRMRIARDAGVLRGWQLATEGRDDAVPCGACGASICGDVERFEVCAGYVHDGVWCDAECRRDGGCGRAPACFDQGRDR